MGALAPVHSWIPEDDLLLKNAVEAGASLESLAKGAVQFSQRFTFQQLQDRWHSLLYDPVVSAEASARMIEFEHSSTLPSKSLGTRDNISVSGKRKPESVRKCYYSLRKRICNDPFNSMDLSFLGAPVTNNVAESGNAPPPADCMLEEAMQNQFRLEDPNFDTTGHAFPNFGTGVGAATSVGVTAHAFCNGHHNCIEDLCVDQNDIQENIPHTFEENLSLDENCCVVEKFDQPRELPVSSLFEPGGLEERAPAMFDQINDNEATFFSGFGGGQVLNSPVSDCGASFHNFGCSSPLPQMPIWSTVEDISAATFPHMNFDEEEQHAGDTFVLPEDGDGNTTNISCDNLKSSAPSADDYLAELSNSLFDFTNEEELLFMDADGKDTIDRSIDGLSSLLLGSPNEDEMPNIPMSELSVPPDEYLNISSGARPGELSDKGHYNCGQAHVICSRQAPMLRYAPAVNPEFPELRNGVICCLLNTEDPEIPCNDDVFLLSHIPSSSSPSSVARWKFHEPNPPTCSGVKDFLVSKRANDLGPKLMKREQINHDPFPTTSQIMGSQLLPDMGLTLPLGDRGVNFELPDSDIQNSAFRNSSTACGGSCQIHSANVSTNNLLPATVEEEVTKTEQAKHLSHNSADFYIEKQDDRLDSLVSGHQENASSSKQEVDVAVAVIENHEALHAELGPIEMTEAELLGKPPSPDQEAFSSEGDDDVPCFSDVEAMILDMDLTPDDDSWSIRDEIIARYQDEATKRTIIRLEHAADACMQRTIASQGAFAVLYGRHSKHYIKKPEVLLGRSTEDVNVDIDMGRGHSNKISRRQAIIKLDKGGTFHLKNLARHSIFVNGKEVAAKHCLSLPSGCLIEIRGIPFIFETSRTRVKEYVNNMGSQN